ncbi:Sir2 family NAD-dependent protein deacetylase [Armatimonas sp.]|uniref:SIR2 family NAD-dependent protein deacylase n=1 Tax=Armatimonas sp. TaxID=1872638 RepID=UPI00286AEE4D|nr:Sir2 family NAD-dependent protein deacetylase [Armatimonas sp.]
MSDNITHAARLIAEADALLIGAGAGMGVDSGLPDFRGPEGFWRAYPPLAARGISFENIACPDWFEWEPRLAWGFYGHRLNLYRSTEPHAGFAILKRWAAQKPHGAFVFTSNVDGQFQKAGFAPEQVIECHGSIHNFQCQRYHCGPVWSAAETEVCVDETTLLADEPLPRCPTCGRIARPNLLMFGDGSWVGAPYDASERRLWSWQRELQAAHAKVVVIELGAGRAIPTVRWLAEAWHGQGATLIRINPREANVPDGAISLRLGACEALEQLDALQ